MRPIESFLVIPLQGDSYVITANELVLRYDHDGCAHAHFYSLDGPLVGYACSPKSVTPYYEDGDDEDEDGAEDPAPRPFRKVPL